MPGAPVENRRQLLVKVSWMLLWMLFLVYPVEDLLSGRHTLAATVLGWLALPVFLGCYIALVIMRSMNGTWWRGSYPTVLVMLAIAVGTSCGLGEAWIGLFTYASVAVGAVLPLRIAMAGVGGVTALMVAVAAATGVERNVLLGLLLPTFLSGAAMTGLQRLVATMRELREAREAVAHLAAAEERLRLARDLHDLLGHSLSLITIKSELAGRLMDQQKQPAARAQVADIEQVARQSLVDVREAVSGFRRPTLPVELVAAKGALAIAGVSLEADPSVLDTLPGLGGPEAGALAWALREAVTNIVRHADGATRCTVSLDRTWEEDGARYAVLEVADDGRGPGKSGPGNGLSGLDERLALVGGRLVSGPGERGRGFRLRALVPLGVAVGVAEPEPGVGTGTVAESESAVESAV